MESQQFYFNLSERARPPSGSRRRSRCCGSPTSRMTVTAAGGQSGEKCIPCLKFSGTHGNCSTAAHPGAAAAHQTISGRLPELGLAAGDQFPTGRQPLHTAARLSAGLPPPHLPGPPLHLGHRHPSDGLVSLGSDMAWGRKPPWPGRALTTATGSKLGAGRTAPLTASSSSPPSSAPQGSSFATNRSPGRTTFCVATASNLFGPGRTSPLALFAAEATTLSSFSCPALRSAPVSASLCFPPTPICYEAAGVSKAYTYTAAASIMLATPNLFSPPPSYSTTWRGSSRGGQLRPLPHRGPLPQLYRQPHHRPGREVERRDLLPRPTLQSGGARAKAGVQQCPGHVC